MIHHFEIASVLVRFDHVVPGFIELRESFALISTGSSNLVYQIAASRELHPGQQTLEAIRSYAITSRIGNT